MSKESKKGLTFTAKLESYSATGESNDYGKEYELKFDNGLVVKKKFKDKVVPVGKSYNVTYDHFWGDTAKGTYDFKNATKIDNVDGYTPTNPPSSSSSSSSSSTQAPTGTVQIKLYDLVYLNSVALNSVVSFSSNVGELLKNYKEVKDFFFMNVEGDLKELTK
jgi:hypothetical protein